MSGSAAALAAPKDRRPTNIFIHQALGEPVPPSAGESPFPLDIYLSWMSGSAAALAAPKDRRPTNIFIHQALGE
ncbi:MAG TPA: hypothetical protein VEN79_01855, partial [Terriglobia bacterium]|nr:hypothetical protein [Terriglobia bacterium]